jgi:hypothetical protein
MRVVDLRRGTWTLAERLIHVASVVHSKRLVSVPRSVPWRALLDLTAWQAVMWPSYAAVVSIGRPSDDAGWALRWLAGLVFVYALSASAYHLLDVGYRVAGFAPPPLHIAPIAARSVQEFWGERWNRTVSTWLGDTFFRPLARRRRPVLGAVAAFVASAALHWYVALVGVGWVMAAWMFAFFMLQFVVIALEWKIRVRTWPPVAGHAWTLAWMTALSPMFIEPAVRAFGY